MKILITLLNAGFVMIIMVVDSDIKVRDYCNFTRKHRRFLTERL